MEKPDKIEYRIFYTTTTLTAIAFAITFCVELGAERYINAIITFALFFITVSLMSHIQKRDS